MRKLLIIGALAIASIGFTACGTTTSTTTKAPAPVVSNGQAIANLLCSKDTSLCGVPASIVEPLATSVCSALASGTPLVDIVLAMESGDTNNALTPDQLGEILGASVVVQCPRFEGTVKAQAQALENLSNT